MTLDVTTCTSMLLHVAKGIKQQVDMLNDADKLGDSDHGTGMEVGFSAVEKKLSSQEFSDLESLFKSCGMAIMMSSGGASGVIFGSLFKDGSKAFQSVPELDAQSFARFLELGLESVMKRGKASTGDKTMLDALKPAADYAAAHTGEPLAQVLQGCAHAAQEGSDSTKHMVAAFGRMKNLGQRTIGFADPGSITMSLILAAMAEFVKSLS